MGITWDVTGSATLYFFTFSGHHCHCTRIEFRNRNILLMLALLFLDISMALLFSWMLAYLFRSVIVLHEPWLWWAGVHSDRIKRSSGSGSRSFCWTFSGSASGVIESNGTFELVKISFERVDISWSAICPTPYPPTPPRPWNFTFQRTRAVGGLKECWCVLHFEFLIFPRS